MNKYPLLSIALIVTFFAFLIITAGWLHLEKKGNTPETSSSEASVPESSVPETSTPESSPLEASVPETSTPEIMIPQISVEEKKGQFKAAIIPAINEVYSDLMQQYQRASELIEAGDDDKLTELKKQYKVTNNDELLMALKPHPQSIAIAQAAMESSWGTSRFFKEANNVFGVWSYNKNEARVAAGKKRGDKTVWVKKYGSVEASIRDYYRTLARGDAYKEFRILKMETNDPYVLIQKLHPYSEKREEYIKELSTIIRFNKFDTYDQQPVTL